MNTGSPPSDPAPLEDLDPEPTLELAFSGGGTRAAAFSLGVFLYFREAGLERSVRQISSVSGGSLTNAFLAGCYTDGGGIQDADVKEYVHRIAQSGIPLERQAKNFATFAGCLAYLGLGGILLALLALDRSWHWAFVVLGAVIACYFFLGSWNYLAQLRATSGVMLRTWFSRFIEPARRRQNRTDRRLSLSSVARTMILPTQRAVTRLLESQSAESGTHSGPLALADIDSPVRHVFSATDLRQGEHVHFSQSWVLSDRNGTTSVSDLRLDEVVRASAAFPGGLPPVKIATGRLALPNEANGGDRWLHLVDGGVRDNLGHAFGTYIQGASESSRDILTNYDSIDLVLVADASAPRGVADLGQGVLAQLPIVKRIPQLTSLPRVIGVMNQSNSEARSLALDAVLRRNRGGCVVSVRQNPFEYLRSRITDPALTRKILRGEHALDVDMCNAHDDRVVGAFVLLATMDEALKNGETAEARWNSDVARNSTIATTLDSLGESGVSRLVRHGFVSAMTQGHVEFGWPLLEPLSWTEERFTPSAAGVPDQ